MGTWILEALGVRRLYLWVARAAHERPIPRAHGGNDPWSKSELEVARGHARLFARLQFGRAVVYSPQVWACHIGGYRVIVGYGLSLLVVHLVFSLLDIYKLTLISRLMPDAREGSVQVESRAPSLESSRGERFFRPQKWESAGVYRAIGIEFFRAITIKVMTTAAVGFGKSHTFVPGGSSLEIVDFERRSRTAELTHWLLLLMTLPLTWGAWASGVLPAALWGTWVTYSDGMLSLLQRYHRLRIWPVVLRARKRG